MAAIDLDVIVKQYQETFSSSPVLFILITLGPSVHFKFDSIEPTYFRSSMWLNLQKQLTDGKNCFTASRCVASSGSTST